MKLLAAIIQGLFYAGFIYGVGVMFGAGAVAGGAISLALMGR